MRKRLTTLLCGVAGFGMVIAGIVGLEPSDATPLPSACIFVSVDVENLVTTTVVKDTDYTTCPSLPPTQPCSGDIGDQTSVTATSAVNAEVVVFACIHDLP